MSQANATPITSINVEAYRAQTDRAARLAEFVGRFAPSYGESQESAYSRSVDEDTPGNILEARNEAVLAAFEAIRVIAEAR